MTAKTCSGSLVLFGCGVKNSVAQAVHEIGAKVFCWSLFVFLESPIYI